MNYLKKIGINENNISNIYMDTQDNNKIINYLLKEKYFN